MVGSAIVRRLQAQGGARLILRDRAELDLNDQAAVERFFAAERPELVYLAAAKVGGIHANNSFPADFIRDNLQIQTHIIESARRHGVRKLAFLGSSCIYPKRASQPMREEHLLTGPLEPTNEWYAVAKIAGIKMCQAYRRQYGFNAICLMPTNLYGPGDNFNLEQAHVLPALVRRFHEAAESSAPRVTIWGTGTPRREFLHVDDLADACVFLMHRYDDEQIINVGTGTDVTIAELAAMIGRVCGFRGELAFDSTRPDGTPRKLLDVSRLASLGWRARTPLESGVEATVRWYRENVRAARR
jgi:GDP-L-fucose synthase